MWYPSLPESRPHVVFVLFWGWIVSTPFIAWLSWRTARKIAQGDPKTIARHRILAVVWSNLGFLIALLLVWGGIEDGQWPLEAIITIVLCGLLDLTGMLAFRFLANAHQAS